MPFSPMSPRPWIASEIRAHVPAASGVFGLSNSGEWIYIGECANLQATLLGILQRPNTVFPRRVPTGFIFEICDSGNRLARQSILVDEYKPACNLPGTPEDLNDSREARLS